MATDKERYLQAAHAMQTGVALEHARGSDDATPKHLRVGINSALVNDAALVRLLIDKGVLTLAEYERAVADQMEREVADYEARLSATGTQVKLL